MDFPEFDRNTLLAGLAVVAVAALLLLTAQAPPGATQNATSTKLLQTEVIDNPPLVLRYGPNASDEILEITNNGTNPSSFDLYSIVPSERASGYSLLSVDNKPPSPGEDAFLSDRVAFRDSLLLQPGGVKTKTFTFQKSGGAPLFLVTKPAAAANETEKFKSLLRKIADLGLTRSESDALQKRLNEVLADANFSAELLDALDSFVDAVKNATETRITNPDYNATDNITRMPMPTTAPAPSPKPSVKPDLNATLEVLPDSITLNANERMLYDYRDFELEAPNGTQTLLVTATLSGTGKQYFGYDLEEFNGIYYLNVHADLNDVKFNSENRIPFDEKTAQIEIEVGSPQLVETASKKVDLKLKVTHQSLPELANPQPPAGFEELPATDSCVQPPSNSGYSIVVDKDEDEGSMNQKFYLYLNGELVDGYPVPVSTGVSQGDVPVGGRLEQRTPTGVFHVTQEVTTDLPTTGPGAIGPVKQFWCIDLRGRIGGNNPACAVGIHGTPYSDAAIGHPNSAGCIMLRNSDFLSLREKVLPYLQSSSVTIKICSSKVQNVNSGWHERVYATYFGCGSDVQSLSTGGSSDAFTMYAALPDDYAKLKKVEVRNPESGETVTLDVRDTGPFCTTDSQYVRGTARPYAETHDGEVCGTIEGNPDCNAQIASNGAGIDLSCDAAEKLFGSKENGYVDWRFTS